MPMQPYAPTRIERAIVVTPKDHAVLELLRQQAVLPADDEAGRERIERQIGELIATTSAPA